MIIFELENQILIMSNIVTFIISFNCKTIEKNIFLIFFHIYKMFKILYLNRN